MKAGIELQLYKLGCVIRAGRKLAHPHSTSQGPAHSPCKFQVLEEEGRGSCLRTWHTERTARIMRSDPVLCM